MRSRGANISPRSFVVGMYKSILGVSWSASISNWNPVHAWLGVCRCAIDRISQLAIREYRIVFEQRPAPLTLSQQHEREGRKDRSNFLRHGSKSWTVLSLHLNSIWPTGVRIINCDGINRSYFLFLSTFTRKSRKNFLNRFYLPDFSGDNKQRSSVGLVSFTFHLNEISTSLTRCWRTSRILST